MEDFEHPEQASLTEYLSTHYRPDVDFVKGRLHDRLFGEFPHSVVRRELMFALRTAESSGMVVLPSIRIRTSVDTVRVADIAVLAAEAPRTRVVEEPPLLCVEVLEPQDDLPEVNARCSDFLAMGVPEVWLFDPDKRVTTVLRTGNETTHRDGSLSLAATGVVVTVAEIFSVLDE